MNKINKTPLYILAVVPNEKIKFEKFLDGGKNSPKNLLENPSYLRYGGWNMLNLDQAKIREGLYWEVRNGDRKIIQLYRDGSLISMVHADSSFLGWGISENDFSETPGLNPLAIIEYTYEFVDFFRELLKFIGSVEKVNFKVGLVNTQLANGKRLVLNSRLPSDIFWFKGKGQKIEKDFTRDISISLEKNTYSSKYVAFLLVQEIFIRFGILPEDIPFSGKDEKGKPYIDTQKFPK